MQIWIVEAEHWYVPGVHRTAWGDLSRAHAQASREVDDLKAQALEWCKGEAGEGLIIEEGGAELWSNRLAIVRRALVLNQGGDEDDAAAHADADGSDEEYDLPDVWISELELDPEDP